VGGEVGFGVGVHRGAHYLAPPMNKARIAGLVRSLTGL